MIEQFKQAAMTHAMKLLSNPKVTKMISDPRVMSAIGKGFELHGQIRSQVETSLRTLAESLNLATKEDVSTLRSKLGQVENTIGDLRTVIEKASKKGSSRKKKTEE